jgi:hypothetical protein
MTDDFDQPKPPDLQEWATRYGGYGKVDWEEWDRAMADYQSELKRRLDKNAQPLHD